MYVVKSLNRFVNFFPKTVLINGFVALCDGSPNSCEFEKTCFRNFAVIYGQLCPVDTSHQIKLLLNDLSNLKFMVDDFECRDRVNSVSKA